MARPPKPRGTTVTSGGISDETSRSTIGDTTKGDDAPPPTLNWKSLRDLATAVGAIKSRLASSTAHADRVLTGTAASGGTAGPAGSSNSSDETQ